MRIHSKLRTSIVENVFGDQWEFGWLLWWCDVFCDWWGLAMRAGDPGCLLACSLLLVWLDSLRWVPYFFITFITLIPYIVALTETMIVINLGILRCHAVGLSSKSTVHLDFPAQLKLLLNWNISSKSLKLSNHAKRLGRCKAKSIKFSGCAVCCCL